MVTVYQTNLILTLVAVFVITACENQFRAKSAKTKAGSTSKTTETTKTTTTTTADVAGSFAITSQIATSDNPTPTLSWTAASGAAGYKLIISTDSKCSSTLYTYETTKTIYQVTDALTAGTYYVCVMAKSSTGKYSDASNNGLSFRILNTFHSKIFETKIELDPNAVSSVDNYPLGITRNPAGGVAVTEKIGANAFYSNVGSSVRFFSDSGVESSCKLTPRWPLGFSQPAEHGVAFDGSGNVYLAGNRNDSVTTAGEDWFIKKYNLSTCSEITAGWNKTINFSGTNEWITRITVDQSNGDVFAAGVSTHTAAPKDRWRVLGFSADGTQKFNVSFGDNDYSRAYEAFVASDGLYVFGYTKNTGSVHFDWTVKKLNKVDGSVLWTTTIASIEYFQKRIFPSFDGSSIYIAGSGSDSTGTYWTAGQSWNWTVMKLSSATGARDGSFLINHHVGVNDYLGDMVVDSTGNFYISGETDTGTQQYVINKYNSAGTQITDANWPKSLGTKPVGATQAVLPMEITSDDKIYVAYNVLNGVSGTSKLDTVVKKINTDGTEVVTGWNKVLDSTYSRVVINSGSTMTKNDSSGATYVMGTATNLISATSATDFFIRKYGPTGIADTTYSFSSDLMMGKINFWLKDFQLDGSGNIYVLGGASNINSGASSDDVFVMKFNHSSGTLVLDWSVSLADHVAGSAESASMMVLNDSFLKIIYSSSFNNSNPDGSLKHVWKMTDVNLSSGSVMSGWPKTFDLGAYYTVQTSMRLPDGSFLVSGNDQYFGDGDDTDAGIQVVEGLTRSRFETIAFDGSSITSNTSLYTAPTYYYSMSRGNSNLGKVDYVYTYNENPNAQCGSWNDYGNLYGNGNNYFVCDDFQGNTYYKYRSLNSDLTWQTIDLIYDVYSTLLGSNLAVTMMYDGNGSIYGKGKTTAASATSSSWYSNFYISRFNSLIVETTRAIGTQPTSIATGGWLSALSINVSNNVLSAVGAGYVKGNYYIAGFSVP